MEAIVDVASSDEHLAELDNSQETHEPPPKKRKPRVDHDDFDKYFDRIKKDEKVIFVCKSLKENGEVCEQEYDGPSNSSAM